MSDLKIIAITGTNGKTTTVTSFNKVLKKKFNVVKSGNLHKKLREIIYKENKYKTLDTEYNILELSSFQLEMTKVKPDIAMILNISPDHLDRYEYDFEKYEAVIISILGIIFVSMTIMSYVMK